MATRSSAYLAGGLLEEVARKVEVLLNTASVIVHVAELTVREGHQLPREDGLAPRALQIFHLQIREVVELMAAVVAVEVVVCVVCVVCVCSRTAYKTRFFHPSSVALEGRSAIRV